MDFSKWTGEPTATLRVIIREEGEHWCTDCTADVLWYCMQEMHHQDEEESVTDAAQSRKQDDIVAALETNYALHESTLFGRLSL